jgi:hypothetical protein
MKYDLFCRERESALVHPNGCRVYVGETSAAGKTHAMGFRPKALKPAWNYLFKGEAQRRAYVEKWLAAYDSQQASKKDYQDSLKPTPEVLKLADPGAIFSYSWGYDQTNIEYWQVVKRSGQMVTIARIVAEDVDDAGGPSQRHIRPAKNAFAMVCGHPMTDWQGKPSICGFSQWAHHHDKNACEGNVSVYGHSYHEFVPVLDTLVKRVRNSGGQPLLAMNHGCGSLVKQVTFGNAPPMVVGSHYETASGWGH